MIDKLTTRQYLKLHPEKYILVTREFSEPIYIAPQQLSGIAVSHTREGAEIWSSFDNTNSRRDYFRAATGYKELLFEQIPNQQ